MLLTHAFQSRPIYFAACPIWEKAIWCSRVSDYTAGTQASNDRPPQRTKSGVPEIPNFRRLLFDFSQLVRLVESYCLNYTNLQPTFKLNVLTFFNFSATLESYFSQLASLQKVTFSNLTFLFSDFRCRRKSQSFEFFCLAAPPPRCPETPHSTFPTAKLTLLTFASA